VVERVASWAEWVKASLEERDPLSDEVKVLRP